MIDAPPTTTTRGGAGRRRSVARLLAVQALYQIEINKVETSGAAAVDAVIAEFVKHRLGQEIEGENYGEADRALFAEYLDVAHAFFAGKEPGMVNGVLDRLARVLRQDDVDHGLGPDRGGGPASR